MLQFLAFVIWWDGYRNDRSSTWASVGLILGVAGLAKGPQPLGYFFIGIAGLLVLARRWRELFGLTLAGVIAGGIVAAWYVAVYESGDIGLWLSQSRIGVKRLLTLYVAEMAKFFIQLTAELMPAPLLLVPFYWSMRKELRAGTDAGPTAQLALALLLYASLVSVVLAFWPGGSNTRYAIPAVPAVATAAGLAFDRMRSGVPRLANLSLAVLVGLAVYQIAIGWILMANFPGPYAKPDRSFAAACGLSCPTTTIPCWSFSNGAVNPASKSVARGYPLTRFRCSPNGAWVLPCFFEASIGTAGRFLGLGLDPGPALPAKTGRGPPGGGI